ncbi:MAG: hypothetical protein QM809_01435 [Gordonia sp. (in: high G+C Gram-positive bacteria)]|uniref:hypothetical protein n=1 Tax=Gordonia sp. (in: high G+C Gram-positive bacteria) TaxID=84139 RepID=UPI0039E64C54
MTGGRPPTHREPLSVVFDVIGSLVLWAVQAVCAVAAWILIHVGAALFPTDANLRLVEDVADVAAVLAAGALLVTAVWALARFLGGRPGFPVVAVGFGVQVALWFAALVVVQAAGVPIV